ncbi:MAG: hypothetical protein K2G60_00035 [Oscillospiraceae bacterium]|nr:hypothetical protein [Oscillospiraceae bacterium]
MSENKNKKSTENTQNNLRIYEKVRAVPDTAKKTIDGGNLKGYTDINPMWRIKTLTELFGPIGEGWYFEKLRDDTITLIDGRIIYTIEINLFYKMDNGEWSIPIFGTGGGTLVSFVRGGLTIDDDAKKKALTDAISICCKELGIGADVYWDKDLSKYGDLASFSPVTLPIPNAPQSNNQAKMVQTMNDITGDDNSPVNTTASAVSAAIQAQNNNSTSPDNGIIYIDPVTTPIPTVKEAEDFVLEGNGQYTGYALKDIFRIAASGDIRATGWLNWLSTASTKSENIAWAQFYANFLRDYYIQEANKAAQKQATTNNDT